MDLQQVRYVLENQAETERCTNSDFQLCLLYFPNVGFLRWPVRIFTFRHFRQRWYTAVIDCVEIKIVELEILDFSKNLHVEYRIANEDKLKDVPDDLIELRLIELVFLICDIFFNFVQTEYETTEKDVDNL